jgi:hypothetical protein
MLPVTPLMTPICVCVLTCLTNYHLKKLISFSKFVVILRFMFKRNVILSQITVTAVDCQVVYTWTWIFKFDVVYIYSSPWWCYYFDVAVLSAISSVRILYITCVSVSCCVLTQSVGCSACCVMQPIPLASVCGLDWFCLFTVKPFVTK